MNPEAGETMARREGWEFQLNPCLLRWEQGLEAELITIGH